jgi:hypothetical protein
MESPPSVTWGRAMPWWQGAHLTWFKLCLCSENDPNLIFCKDENMRHAVHFVFIIGKVTAYEARARTWFSQRIVGKFIFIATSWMALAPIHFLIKWSVKLNSPPSSAEVENAFSSNSEGDADQFLWCKFYYEQSFSCPHFLYNCMLFPRTAHF